MNSELSSTKAKYVLVSVGQMEDLLLFFVISLDFRLLVGVCTTTKVSPWAIINGIIF